MSDIPIHEQQEIERVNAYSWPRVVGYFRTSTPVRAPAMTVFTARVRRAVSSCGERRALSSASARTKSSRSAKVPHSFIDGARHRAKVPHSFIDGGRHRANVPPSFVDGARRCANVLRCFVDGGRHCANVRPPSLDVARHGAKVPHSFVDVAPLRANVSPSFIDGARHVFGEDPRERRLFASAARRAGLGKARACARVPAHARRGDCGGRAGRCGCRCPVLGGSGRSQAEIVAESSGDRVKGDAR
jgi:hypothetical protein